MAVTLIPMICHHVDIFHTLNILAVVAAWDTNGQIPELPIPRNNLWVLGGAGPYNQAEQDSWIGFEF